VDQVPDSRDDRAKLWLHRAQIPIGLTGIVLGIYEAATGYILVGIIVAAIAALAATVAVSRLRR
jgi:hypothetical protein